MHRIQYDTALALARKAFEAGARQRVWPDGKVTLRSLDWDIAGNCENPRYIEIGARVGSRDASRWVYPLKQGGTVSVRMSVRCRTCQRCLKKRAAMWRHRALAECDYAPRTWFCTFTFRPTKQTEFLNRARLRMHRQGLDYDSLAPQDRLGLLDDEAYKSIQDFIKRVRKNSRASLRYLVVTEAHKSGAVHYHALIHEQNPDCPVRHSVLSKAWRDGFAKFNLLHDRQQATYVTKYLHKTARARVRASGRYGHPAYRHSLHSEGSSVTIDPSNKPVMRTDHETSERVSDCVPCRSSELQSHAAGGTRLSTVIPSE